MTDPYNVQVVRSHFNMDWAASLQRWLGDLVDKNFRRDRPIWPTLTSFDAEIYRCGQDARLLVIRDKPSAHAIPSIASGNDVVAWPSQLPTVDNPFDPDKLPSLLAAIYNHFNLRPQDYAMVIPDTDCETVADDVESWTSEVHAAVTSQMNFAISRHYQYVHELDEAPPLAPTGSKVHVYVNEALIEELAGTSGIWHTGKLIAMLRELNVNYQAGHAYSCLMLCRAIMDHIPPVFDRQRFAEIGATVSGVSQTDKRHFATIANNRFASDDVLHRHIRRSADLIEVADLPPRTAMNALVRLIIDRIAQA